MADYILSTNMNLPVPIVSQAPGPEWATLLNDCLTVIDTHDHSTGSGVPITPAGLNINSDLSINSNSLILVHRTNYQNLTSTLATTNTNSIYVVNGDLWYNDNASHQIRITQNGNVTGAAGNITGLVSPASASYVAISQTFVWQSDVNQPANMDAASYILRNLVANSKGLTLSPPTAMAADYTLVLPSLPASQKIMTLDASGNISAPYTVDNSTITIASNVIGVPSNGITQTQLATRGLATDTGALGEFVQALSSSGGFTVSGATYSFISGQTITLTTKGRPIFVTFLGKPGSVINKSGANDALIGFSADTGVTFFAECQFGTSGDYSPTSFSGIYFAPAGTHTITAWGQTIAGTLAVTNCQMIAWEM